MDVLAMSSTFDVLAKQALDLPRRQRLKLAEVLLVSADGDADQECDTAWSTEIEARILAIDSGREAGIAFEEVVAEANQLFAK
jgi:putative addiction module component (TIGR02574 family)